MRRLTLQEARIPAWSKPGHVKGDEPLIAKPSFNARQAKILDLGSAELSGPRFGRGSVLHVSTIDPQVARENAVHAAL